MSVPFNTLTLPANLKGRDIVIGDLHGCFNVFEKLMERIQFDPAADRVLSVGDLCDRGPENLRCLQLKNNPWFYSVMGNHEAVIEDDLQFSLDLDLTKAQDQQVFLQHLYGRVRGMGSLWLSMHLRAHDFDPVAIKDLLSLVNLPYLIRVEDDKSPYQLVHANVFEAQITNDKVIDSMIKLGRCTQQVLTKLVWSRSLCEEAELNHANASQLIETGLRLTLCGHCVVDAPIRYRSHIFLDTGCAYINDANSALTAYIVQDDRFVRVANHDRRLSSSCW